MIRSNAAEIDYPKRLVKKKEHYRRDWERYRKKERGRKREKERKRNTKINKKYYKKWKNKELSVSYTVDPGKHEKNWEASYRARWDDVKNHSENEKRNILKSKDENNRIWFWTCAACRSCMKCAFIDSASVTCSFSGQTFLFFCFTKATQRERKKKKKQYEEGNLFSAYNLNRIHLFSGLFYLNFYRRFFSTFETIQRTVYLYTLIFFFFWCFIQNEKLTNKISI